MSRLEKECPFAELDAHGLAVGLPDGLMGNSEVGHLNIGAGRIVYQVGHLQRCWACYFGIHGVRVRLDSLA